MGIATSYTFGVRLEGSPSANRPRVEEALKAEGFGVLTEIDVQATMKAKLSIDRPPYLILGACNPTLAQRAITVDPSVGALLPCNVVLRAEGDCTIVEAMDPRAALGLVDSRDIEPIAREAWERLGRAIAALETPEAR